MKQIVLAILVTTLLLSNMIWSMPNQEEYLKNWPTWRGPLMTGEVPNGNPPVKWSETENIRWKIPIPGKGLSTPIIWGDKIFLTTAIPSEKKATSEQIDTHSKGRPMWLRASGNSTTTDFYQKFVVMAISRKDGQILWEKTVREEYPHEARHDDGSWASPSCVTDGNILIASFGSFGIYGLDLNGNLLWEKDLGTLYISQTFGEGSSPVLYEDFLIVNWDHEKESFLFVLDKKTGEVIWKKSRETETSWSTPLVVEIKGKPQIVVSATEKSMGYDLKSGEVIWEISGMTGNVIPSPLAMDSKVFLLSGFRGAAIQAIDLSEAKGNLEGTPAVIWQDDKNTPYVPSALLYQGNLYYLKGNRESLTCRDAKTGAIHYTKQDLDGMKDVYASPVAAADRIYIVGRNGVTFVLKSGAQFEVLAQNALEDKFDASPAIAGNELYLRGLKYLYCVAGK